MYGQLLVKFKSLESESNACPRGSKVTWYNYDILRQTRWWRQTGVARWGQTHILWDFVMVYISIWSIWQLTLSTSNSQGTKEFVQVSCRVRDRENLVNLRKTEWPKRDICFIWYFHELLLTGNTAVRWPNRSLFTTSCRCRRGCTHQNDSKSAFFP